MDAVVAELDWFRWDWFGWQRWRIVDFQFQHRWLARSRWWNCAAYPDLPGDFKLAL
jgi:hypothetical protein